MTAKTNLTIYLDEELSNLAREMGLNISKTCENALKMSINRLQVINSETNSEKQHVNARQLVAKLFGLTFSCLTDLYLAELSVWYGEE